MSTFATTFNPTSFGLFDTEIRFQNEADSMVTYVKRSLGDNVLSVELASKTIWDCLEQATLSWGAIINEFQAKSNLSTLLGQNISGTIENKYPRETLDFLVRQAEPYSMLGSYAGYQNQLSGAIELVRGQQDYNLWTDLKDGNDIPLLLQSGTVGGAGRMRVTEVFHFSPATSFRFFDSTSAINYLNNEFSFESFTPETIFYVLPVFEDILRAGQLQLSERVRRSNFSYKIIGHSIRVFPTPNGRTAPRNLFIRVMFDSGNPTSPLMGGPSGSLDHTVDGISSLSNIPYGNIPYHTINSVGMQWIREYTLALCMIRLAWIRGKMKNLPVNGQDLQLNYDDLLTRGFDEKLRLIEQIRGQLDEMTYDVLMEKQAAKAENLTKQLRGVPMPNGWFIVPG